MSEAAIEKINKHFTNILRISNDIFRESHGGFVEAKPPENFDRCSLTQPNFIKLRGLGAEPRKKFAFLQRIVNFFLLLK